MIEDLLHIGIGVKDLKKSVHFYKKVMGMDIEYRAQNSGEKISEVVGVKDAELMVCVMKKGDIRIELIDYGKNSKKSESRYKHQDGLGLLHIAFKVKDIDSEYKKIKSLGYVFNTRPTICRENGPKICYFKGPDNVTIEINPPKPLILGWSQYHKRYHGGAGRGLFRKSMRWTLWYVRNVGVKCK